MKPKHHITIQITSFFIAFLGVWCMDTAITANNGGLVLVNLTHTADPTTMYHIGLYCLLLGMFVMLLNSVQYMVKD